MTGGGGDRWPAGLEAAFTAYEEALMRDDTDLLDALFEPGSETLRGDDAGLLRGHDAISAFRTRRGGVAPRTIASVEVRPVGGDTVLVVGESAFAGGGRGLQTQLWRRTDGVWRIAVAHVTGRPRAFDRSIWRVLGDPLVHGTGAGPLAGVRVAVKDLFDIAGQVVGAGNPEHERSAPTATETAAALRALLDAGADVAGIAGTDEFAYALAGRNAHFGAPPNGADGTRIGGGSTSGPASAVALGQADLGLGTDTAGSLRVPASYQGLWGLRTTHDAVSRHGVLPLAQSFDTVGWLARSPDVLTAAATVSLSDTATDVDDGTLLVAEALLDAAEPDTARAFAAWVADTGRPVRRIVLPDLDDLAETLRVVQAAEAWRNHGRWIGEHPGSLGEDVAARFTAAAAVTADDEDTARARLPELRARIRDAVGGGVLCLPTVPGPAPLRTATGPDVLATRRATLRMTAVAGVGGLPALSAPLLHVGGAPVGVCLVGGPDTDRDLVAAAATFPTHLSNPSHPLRPSHPSR
ncbi:Asp-tRNA(Asn)/Glu-tRNA(Gln) amidotransferase A subunit family amidase [Curtobacterium pusillum]|uniref:Asp-tRNA(Asn)/Glu-tRNA(Gln) amidotransferase A subunit family amidase n=1 Tax=Curtobacterium pusillum TaxID=69373 RepID=A0AAW3T9A8_9MICO|nr:Asp-tRNA(Asn)/Glu-tRNA(Gln) amidotransferase A subunit family amidase [Curtobacterium pusillum]